MVLLPFFCFGGKAKRTFPFLCLPTPKKKTPDRRLVSFLIRPLNLHMPSLQKHCFVLCIYTGYILIILLYIAHHSSNSQNSKGNMSVNSNMSKTFVESTVLRKPHLIISNLAVLTGFSLKHRKFHHIFVDIRPGGGVLPYMGYIGTCRGIGYGF